eukprot:Rmarinus@m.16972
MELGYWRLRGRGAPIRALLAHVGVDYKETLYTIGEGPDFDCSSWFGKKEDMGLDFPNLPYFVDGDVRLTQTAAILRYLGRKYNLDAETETQRCRIDMLFDEVHEWAVQFMRAMKGGPTYSEEIAAFGRASAARLHKIEEFLGDEPWVAGNKLTYVDFLLYEVLDWIRMVFIDAYDPYPRISAFMKRFEALPGIRKFHKGPKFERKRFLTPFSEHYKEMLNDSPSKSYHRKMHS